MMPDLMPKIGDVSSLKGISTILALPVICVAYVYQTGLELSFDGNVIFDIPTDIGESQQLNRAILIFILKSMWISGIASVFYSLLVLAHIEWRFPFLSFASTVLIAFAIFGIFGNSKFEVIKSINEFWYYAFIVWGLFLQAMREQIDGNKTNKSSHSAN